MSDDDPFAEPNDTDKTVIRPNPGGRRASIAQSGATKPVETPREAPRRAKREEGPSLRAREESAAQLKTSLTGLNPLNACAATLFSLASRIRNRAQHRDPGALRQSVVDEVNAFEARAVRHGVDPKTVKVARYAICATIDDVVLNTPWGGDSVWGQQSLVATFHRETVGGDRFYDLLARLEQDPVANIDLLEFLYICLSVGFEGRLRVEQGGQEKHAAILSGLANLIRGSRPTPEKDLSPKWEGVERPHRLLSVWKPVWIAAGAVAACLVLVFVSLAFAVSRSSADVITELAAMEPSSPAVLARRAPPVEPPPQSEAQLDRLSGFLQQEIDEGIVSVFQSGNKITIRIRGAGMFGSGSANLQNAFTRPLARVADALNDTSGPVLVVGHSDNIPIRTAQFPSNMHLSLARAKSVADSIRPMVSSPDRIRIQAQADKFPIATNRTAEGRARNRRIEIVLMREDAV